MLQCLTVSPWHYLRRGLAHFRCRKRPVSARKKIGKFVYEAISLGLLSVANISIKIYLGDEPPANWTKQVHEVYQNQANKGFLKQIGLEMLALNWQGAAGHLWTFVVELFQAGVLTSLIQEALSRMSWWEC